MSFSKVLNTFWHLTLLVGSVEKAWMALAYSPESVAEQAAGLGVDDFLQPRLTNKQIINVAINMNFAQKIG
jgi:hypothetical protein